MKKTISLFLVCCLCVTSIFTLVACAGKSEVEKIEVTSTNLSCYVGDTFDTDGIQIRITYTDGKTADETVKSAGATATALDTSSAGTKTVTITLGGKTATASVTVRTKSQGGNGNEGGEEQFSYYKTSRLPDDKVVYVINNTDLGYNLSADQLFTAQAIQGLFARKSTSIYVDSHYMTNGLNTDMYYIEKAAEEYDLTLTDITLAQAVEMYKEAWSANVADGTWGSQIPMDTFVQKTYKAYVEGQDYSTPGYILYKGGNFSVNTAATLAGITGFLPVEKNDEDSYIAMGLTKKFDLDNVAFTYKWLFECVLSELSPDGLIHQNYRDESSLTNKFIKDYGICNKFFHIYYDDASQVTNSFKNTLHNFVNHNSAIFGYTFSEDSDVAFFSKFGQFIVPTDYTCNLTFYSAKEFAKAKFSQPNNDKDLPAQEGKHYVAFVVSDGDNATYWQNTAAFATNYMNAAGRDKDSFPVTWSITPSLSDLMPLVLDNVYNTKANDYDYFCAPVSGQGYINAGNFAAESDGAFFRDFCEKLDIYMGKADLSTVTVIGGSAQGNLPGVLAGYASCNNVKGGIVYEGNKYFGGVRGGVMWLNGKPFVGPRDSLWQTTPAYIAARINTYPKDIHSIDGYTIVNVHPWSHSYDDIRTIVNMLGDNIEVVSVDRIINMMTANITDKSNTNSFKIPALNGVSISESDLQSHPELIPVDPLYNDFLLWEEDWSGSGVQYNNSDAACSNVGAMYAGNISIAAGAKATKASFQLPDIDNYWFSFSARADSLSASQLATFSVDMTIDGVKKTVMKSVQVKGVSGTETQTVTGDGWQCFAFPLKQYFADYRKKDCVVEISVETGGVGIRLDQVRFVDRTLDGAIDPTSYDPYNNVFATSTEDWMLGEQYKTSQYYWWDVRDREDLKFVNCIQIDCSDGGGDEKRNGNTNMWMAKNYVLPTSDAITISFKVSSDNSTGAYLKISLYVDGNYLVLYDWKSANSAENRNVTINLAETYPDVDFSGKEVTVVFEARDGGRHNGVGEACQLHSFVTTYEE